MRAVLWDLDGTIADTENLHFRAWQAIMDECGIRFDYERFLADFGRRNSEILPELLDVEPGAELVEQVAQRKEAKFRSLLHTDGLRLLPGVAEWLGRFQEAGVRQAISSSGSMANITAIVNELEIGDFFLALLSGANLPKGKPDPAIFLSSAAALAVTAQDCIVVEDSIHGIEAARRAHMAAIAVGQVAKSVDLQELMSVADTPGCLTIRDLHCLRWQDCAGLWSSTRESIDDS